MKTNLTRRTLVKGDTALATSAALTGPGLLEWAKTWAQTAPWRPEKGAPHPLNAYAANPVWTEEPKRTAFRDAAERSLSIGGLGSVGEKAANAFFDFVLVDMFASYCTGREDAKSAIKIAERQPQRIYR